MDTITSPVPQAPEPQDTSANRTPVPRPSPAKAESSAQHRDATRYGDWEMKGRCIDF